MVQQLLFRNTFVEYKEAQSFLNNKLFYNSIQPMLEPMPFNFKKSRVLHVELQIMNVNNLKYKNIVNNKLVHNFHLSSPTSIIYLL